MAGEKQVWRFQCDPPLGEKDPMVTVFLGELETYDGTVSVRQDTRDPVTMKTSELVVLMATPEKITELQEKQRAERKANAGPQPTNGGNDQKDNG